MKRNLFLTFVLLLVVFYCQIVFGAGASTTATVTDSSSVPGGYIWTITATADDTTGTFDDIALTAAQAAKLKGAYLYQVITNPGSTAPTDNWDVSMTNSDGTAGNPCVPDILGNQCLNRDTTNTEVCYPINYYYVDGILTASIDGNSTNSATLSIKVLFVR